MDIMRIGMMVVLVLLGLMVMAQDVPIAKNLTVHEEDFDCASPCPVLVTKTYVLSPSPRTRTTLGVGESVEIKVRKNKNNKCGTPVFTIVENESGGILMEMTSDTYVFIAGINNGVTKIKVTFDASNCDTQCGTPFELEVIFNVLRPTGLTVENASYSLNGINCGSLMYAPNRPSTGFAAKVYILPDNVNFHNILTREQNATPVLTGTYPTEILAMGVNIPDHPQNLFWENTSGVRTKLFLY